MGSYKGVVFDFNGTLFFDNPKHILAWGAISREIRGHDISEEELYTKLNGVPNAKIIAYFTNNQATKEEVEKYSLKKETYYRAYCKEDKATFHLVEGVEAYFDALKENHIPFTIASASIKPNIDFFVESFHLDRWMAPESIVYDDGTYDNKIAMFKDACAKLHLDPSEVRVYEDSISGVNNAYKAGIKEIVVICDEDKEEEFKHLPGVVKLMRDFSKQTV